MPSESEAVFRLKERFLPRWRLFKLGRMENGVAVNLPYVILVVYDEIVMAVWLQVIS